MVAEVPAKALPIDNTSLKGMLIKHEGLRLFPYLCPAGKLTVGVGRNLTDTGISIDEAMDLLENDISRVTRELEDNFPWFMVLNKARREALVDMCFNLGLSRFRKFSKMIEALQRDDFAIAAKEMLSSRWAQQVGKRAAELARIMLEGKP